MARIFITGSSDGLGRLAAEVLLDGGHQLVVHARNPDRLAAVEPLLKRGAVGVAGDLADGEQTRGLARRLNELGTMDAVIHNAGVYTGVPVLHINVVAPYLLTTLMDRPKRLVYLSSGLHTGGQPRLEGLDWTGRRPSGSYADSKLFIAALAAGLARRWPEVLVNAVDPGWVPTRMGGPGAPDDLRLGHLTQEWLATSEDPEARTSGGYWHHQRRLQAHPAVADPEFQDELIETLARHTGVSPD